MGLEFGKETYAIIGAAMEVHSEMGPGYEEAVYHESMEIEFGKREIPFVSEPTLKIQYKGQTLKRQYRPDFIVYEAVVVELKARSTPLDSADQKQILNSLKSSDLRVGLLFNFGRPSLEHKRFVL